MEPEGDAIPSISSSPPPSDDHPDFSPVGSPDLWDHHHQLPPLADQPPSTLPDDLRDKILKQMEPEGVAIPSISSSPPPSDDHLDSSPVGSPDLSDNHHQLPPLADQPPSALPDDLRDKILKQVEYYFSDENLPTDKFLMKYVSRDKEGYVPIGVVASLRKIKKLTRDASLIVTALRESSLLVVSPNEKKVKRLQPHPSTEIKDPMLCTVLVENLPHDHSLENLQRVFGEAGNITNITVRDPHAARESKKVTTAEKLLVGKLHALVEYDTVEAAEKAVGMLNNEQDWRYGLRVKLLKKKTKADVSRKVWREVDTEKNNTVQATNPAVEEENHYSSDHRDESHDEEGEELTKDKTGEHSQKENNVQRNRHRGRGRRQKYHGTNGHGHGTPPSGHVVEPSKPPPGPKMPDGTRGFSMGRGRPLVSDAS